jgi:hypothetical protein
MFAVYCDDGADTNGLVPGDPACGWALADMPKREPSADPAFAAAFIPEDKRDPRPCWTDA